MSTATRPDTAAHGEALPPSTTTTDRSSRTVGLVRTQLVPLWSNRWYGLIAAAGSAAVWAVIAASWTPRGPLTTSQALWSVVFSTAVGAVAGLTARSRWTALVAPAAFAMVVELVRLGTDGPLVDGPHFSTYGLLALIVGRGVHGLVSLAPMALGAIIGAAAGRTLTELAEPGAPSTRRSRLFLRRTGAGLAVVAGLVVIAGLARPASTAPITDGNGDTIPTSVAELTTLEVNGHDLGLMIRGHNTDNPVLLFLAGGPGGSELGAMRNHLSDLEEHFTVVTWDQRGTGKSYPQLDPVSTISLRGYVDDTFVVTDHLRERFDQERIYLLGQSWGSLLGVLAVQEAPDRYRAYIGTGQMVSPLRTDTIFYQDTLTWAEASGRDGLAEELRKIGPPPYDSVLNYETALSYEHEVYPYDHSANSEGGGGFSENFFVSEYTLLEQFHLLGAFMDTFTVLYPQIQDLDLADTATDFEVPVYFVQGAHEADGRAQPFDGWYPTITAPTKDLTVLETSGHRPLFEQPEPFVDYMVDTVLSEIQAR